MKKKLPDDWKARQETQAIVDFLYPMYPMGCATVSAKRFESRHVWQDKI